MNELALKQLDSVNTLIKGITNGLQVQSFEYMMFKLVQEKIQEAARTIAMDGARRVVCKNTF